MSDPTVKRPSDWWRLIFLLSLVLAGCTGDESPTEPVQAAAQGSEETAAPTSLTVEVSREAGESETTFCGEDCTEDAGYRWAMQQSITNPEKCGGPLLFFEGCRRYAVEHEDEHGN